MQTSGAMLAYGYKLLVMALIVLELQKKFKPCIQSSPKLDRIVCFGHSLGSATEVKSNNYNVNIDNLKCT